MSCAELLDIEKKTTILLQTQITSEELSVEAKVDPQHPFCVCLGLAGFAQLVLQWRYFDTSWLFAQRPVSYAPQPYASKPCGL